MQHGQDWQPEDGARERRIKQLLLSAVNRCSECRRQYHLDDFAVIGHRDHLWMVTVICEGCQSQGFITAIVDDQSGGQALPAPADERPRLSELTPDEEARFATLPPLDSLDVLDLHEFLETFNGDFAALFQQRG